MIDNLQIPVLPFFVCCIAVFQTGMVGYPESLTDPSYHSQILVLTYPLIGNYGIPKLTNDAYGLPEKFESRRVWPVALVVGEYCNTPSHWQAAMTLHDWLKENGVPGLAGIDTRELTKTIRERGTMKGRIYNQGSSAPPIFKSIPEFGNLVKDVSCRSRVSYNPTGKPLIIVVDCGLKFNQLRCLLDRGARVDVVPWDAHLEKVQYDGLFISNGPGDPAMCLATMDQLRRVIHAKTVKPVFGICLGHQLLAIAAGAKTFKMK